MKRRSDRLQRVTDLAEQRTEEAAQQVAERNRDLEQARQQLEELKRFRDDYARPPTAHGSISATALMNRQQFLHRIDQAMVQQRATIQRLTHQAEKARHEWLQLRSRSAALDGVTQRYRDQESRAEDRLEQAAIDERMQHRRGGWRDD